METKITTKSREIWQIIGIRGRPRAGQFPTEKAAWSAIFGTLVRGLTFEQEIEDAKRKGYKVERVNTPSGIEVWEKGKIL